MMPQPAPVPMPQAMMVSLHMLLCAVRQTETVFTDIDPKLQDDEVELLLQSQRDEACYFCPPDYKRVTVLTDKTYQSFIDKRKTAIVLFWLNGKWVCLLT